MSTTTSDPAAVADAYFDAWRRNAPAELRDLLASDVRVNGPLGQVDGAAQYEPSLGHIFALTRDLEMQKRWIDDGDVLTWFDLYPHGDVEPFPVANWLRIEDGRITRVRVTFDVTKLLAAGDPPAPRAERH